jgi:hypothetical protein
VIFRSDLIVQDVIVDRNESALARPVGTGGTEVGLWAGLRAASHDTAGERRAGSAFGEDQKELWVEATSTP